MGVLSILIVQQVVNFSLNAVTSEVIPLAGRVLRSWSEMQKTSSHKTKRLYNSMQKRNGGIIRENDIIIMSITLGVD